MEYTQRSPSRKTAKAPALRSYSDVSNRSCPLVFFSLLDEASLLSNNNVRPYSERDISQLISKYQRFLANSSKGPDMKGKYYGYLFQDVLDGPLQVGEARAKGKITNRLHEVSPCFICWDCSHGDWCTQRRACQLSMLVR